MPKTKAENILEIINLVNVAIPGVASIIVSLKSGKKIDLKELHDKTDAEFQATIDEANKFLADI